MPELPDLRAGIYRHYKGPLYMAFGYGHDANADTLAPTNAHGRPIGDAMGERNVVVYMALELQDAHTGPRLAVRNVFGADSWFNRVCPNTECSQYGTAVSALPKCTECKERLVTRYEYVGPSWEGND